MRGIPSLAPPSGAEWFIGRVSVSRRLHRQAHADAFAKPQLALPIVTGVVEVTM